MGSKNYGASKEAWDAFASLNLPDLLPWIADPNVVMHPTSKIRASGDRIPTFIDEDGFGLGMLGWADRVTTSVDDWRQDPRLGICMITRRIRCIDIDIPDVGLSVEVEMMIRETLGIAGMGLPLRDRENSGKRALLYRVDYNEPLRKHVIRVSNDGGNIEFLFDRQQIAVAGTHPSGALYRFPEGIPEKIDDIPMIEFQELQDLIRDIGDEFGETGWVREWRFQANRVPTERSKAPDSPVIRYMQEHELILDYGPQGQMYVKCPWEDGHSTPPNGTDTAFYPPGSNNVKDSGFSCLHASCIERNHFDYLTAIGYQAQEIDSQFPIVTGKEDRTVIERPKFTTRKNGEILPTLTNLTRLLMWTGGFGFDIRYDTFKDELVFTSTKDIEWETVSDDTYTKFRLRATECGMEDSVSKDMMRDAVSFVARQREFDSAEKWLLSKKWDGVPRIAQLASRAFHLRDTEYHTAVMQYMWSALAGRVLEPGVKADMVPIIQGAQGLRKSTVVEMFAPSPDEFTEISLDDKDENLSRQLRGKMVACWDELKGINYREADATKGWISRRKDEWVPKYKEFASTMLRRFVVIGTANPARYLDDPTGLRRWLPLRVTQVIDTDYIESIRDQLWAEGAELFRKHGVMWKDAERLAGPELKHATIRDPWVDVVEQWLQDKRGGFTSLEVLQQACSVPTSRINHTVYGRLQRVMAFLQWHESDAGHWHPNDV